MKRLIILAVMAAFILGTVGMAKAAQLSISGGDFRVHGNYVKNPNFDKDDDSDSLNFYQRFRSTFNFVANENLRAVVQMQFGGAGGDALWGDRNQVDQFTRRGHASGNFGDVNFRQSYLEFMVPNTQATVKAGWQWWALPSTLGSHIFDFRVPAVVVNTPITDMVGLTVGYARSDDTALEKDSFDHFLAIVPVTMDGFEINPFVWYANQGSNAPGNETSRNFFWGGINATVDMFDPVVIHGDFNFGQAGKQVSGTRIGEQRGWITALAVEYKMDMLTPMVFGLYESGEDRRSATDERRGRVMPRVAGDLNFTSFGFAGSQFGGTSWYQFDGMTGGPSHTGGASGKWAVGLKLQDISFMDDLTHEFQLVYYEGTNRAVENNAQLFTRDDRAWEVNFNSSYQVYENLAAILELGYLAPSIKDADDRNLTDDDSWKAAAGFRYRF